MPVPSTLTGTTVDRWVALVAPQLNAGLDAQQRVVPLGWKKSGTTVDLRFLASRDTNFVRVHVQSTASGKGGVDYDDTNFVSSTEVDCRESRQQDVEITVNDTDDYYVFLIPVADFNGTKVKYDGESGNGADQMTLVDLSGAEDLDGKLDADGWTEGDIVQADASGVLTALPIGSASQILQVNSGGTALEYVNAASADFVGAIAVTASAQSIPDVTWTVVNFDGTDILDTDGFHDPSTNNSRMTIPSGKAGKYLAVFQIAFAASSAGMRGGQLYKNGAEISGFRAFHQVPPVAGAGFLTVFQSMGIIDVAVGDYIQGAAFQNTGGALNTHTEWSFLMVSFLGT